MSQQKIHGARDSDNISDVLVDGSDLSVSVHNGSSFVKVAQGAHAEFSGRSELVTADLSALPDGAVILAGGLFYEVDSAKTGVDSAINDMSFDGLAPYGQWHPGHFGPTVVSSQSSAYVSTGQFQLNGATSLGGHNEYATTIRNESSDAAIKVIGLSSGGKSAGNKITDLRVSTEDYALGSGYGLSTVDQSYPYIENGHFAGGLSAAHYSEGVVGYRGVHNHYQRSKVAQEFKNLAGGGQGNTAHVEVGSKRRLSGSAIKNTGHMRQFTSVGGVFEAVNLVVEQTDSEEISGFTSYADWFEGVGRGRMDFSSGAPVYNASSDGALVTNGMNVPVFDRSYTAGVTSFEGSIMPKVINAHITPEGTYGKFTFAGQEVPGAFEFSGTVKGWGKDTVHGLVSTLPTVGAWEAPTTAYKRQGVYHSVAATNRSGVYDGVSQGCANLFETSIDSTGWQGGAQYWPYAVSLGGTISETPGQADPHGGSTAVKVSQGYKATSNISAFSGGGKWATMAVIAKVDNAGERVYLQAYDTTSTFVEVLDLEVPRTEWRVFYMTAYLPAVVGREYRFGIGSNGGSLTVARAALYEGADLHPVLRYGEAVSQPFTQENGKIKLFGQTLPTGSFSLGDKFTYDDPIAAGFVGAVHDGAIWKNYGAVV